MLKNKTCNLYITFGTLPGLFSQINVFLDKTPSYVWVRSGGIFVSKEYFPDNLLSYKKFDGYNDADFFNYQYKDVIKTIVSIVKKNKDVTFNVFCDDSRIQFILKVFIPLGFDKFIKKIIILSEGSITESMFADVNSTYFDLKEKKWKTFITFLSDKRTNKNEIDNQLALIDNYSFWLSTLPNVEYLIPNLKVLLSKKPHINLQRKMNLCDLNISGMYKKLPLNIRDKFVSGAIGSLKIKKMFKNHSNNILIVSGTYNFANEEITTFIYKSLIKKVIDDYGKKYIIFYKAHPLFPVKNNLSLLNFLDKNNVLFLPEKVPLEILLWEYKKVKTGGFCSSTHALIPKKQVEFFFGELNGFSKYLFRNKKKYNINLSQEFAALSLKYYYDFVSLIGRINALDEKLNSIQTKMDLIKNELLK